MYINTTNITTWINNFNSEITALESEYKKIISQIQGLKNGWDTDKATAFYNYFEKKYFPALQTAINEMKKYSEYLSKIPITYKNLDDLYSTEIKV